ncbi:unnamed protein product [Rhizophagus irregularis]|uniref:Uncharacterized protein n=1 Tax=Rhizophagus irregularis TaxID=588596 RepID=A0A915ZWV7_9GLOM|nr:unnamed protein product [Rhizophagus irregularis]CAB5394173.1 unnamed protein product [Rhizophagus irregularis]
MFKRKSSLPAPPTTLSFTDILSDLTRLQTYHQTHIGEKIDVLEIVKTEDSADEGPAPNPIPKILSPTFLGNLNKVDDASSEVVSNTYEIITNFIRVNEQLIKSQKDLDGLGSDIEVLRKELRGTIDTLNNSNIPIGEGDDIRMKNCKHDPGLKPYFLLTRSLHTLSDLCVRGIRDNLLR